VATLDPLNMDAIQLRQEALHLQTRSRKLLYNGYLKSSRSGRRKMAKLSWLERIRQIVERSDDGAAWTPNRLDADFFGESSCLPYAFRKAIEAADTLGSLNDLEVLLSRLEKVPYFEYIYADEEVRKQGRLLLLGMAKTIRAGCQYILAGKQPTDEAIGLLRQAAETYNDAWPWPWVGAPPSTPPSGEKLFLEYSALCMDCVPMTTPGFWVVWDLLDRLLGDRPDRAKPRVSGADLPVPLYSPSRGGEMALLTIDLVHDGGSVFCPDPLGMGLTTLKSDLRESMQHVFDLSGLRNQGCRGRWRITTHQPEAEGPDQADLHVPYFHGRSLEAATCCILWAALGAIPGREEIAKELLPLDSKATISAELGDRDGEDRDPRRISLKLVDALPFKRDAAERAGLNFMVVASDEVAVSLSTDRLDVLPLKTVGEAFDHLLRCSRYVRNYQQNVRRKWDNRWPLVLGEDDA